MAVNVSGRQIRDPGLAADIRAAIAAAGVDPRQMILELTESVLVTDPAGVALTLAELKGLGLRIAVDDFGTGYSSLAYLQDLPIDILKIDKSFVDRASSPPGDGAPLLLPAIIGLARSLGLRTVAEGIEHVGQAVELIEHGCDFGQGYLWAKPLPAAEAETLIRSLGDAPQTA